MTNILGNYKCIDLCRDGGIVSLAGVLYLRAARLQNELPPENFNPIRKVVRKTRKIRQEKGAQTQTFGSGYDPLVGWGSSA